MWRRYGDALYALAVLTIFVIEAIVMSVVGGTKVNLQGLVGLLPSYSLMDTADWHGPRAARRPSIRLAVAGSFRSKRLVMLGADPA